MGDIGVPVSITWRASLRPEMLVAVGMGDVPRCSWPLHASMAWQWAKLAPRDARDAMSREEMDVSLPRNELGPNGHLTPLFRWKPQN